MTTLVPSSLDTVPVPLADGPAQLVARRVPGRSLEAPFYTSPEFFDLDVAAVFARSWIFVATEAEVREPGDFVTIELGNRSVILVRGDDGRVRALHNVCRHRGSRVLTEPKGSVGNIVCGYHQWTYGTDGSLRHAGDQPAGFDPTCFGLKPVHVRSVSGLLFICLADEPPSDFDDVAGRLEPYLRPHQLRRTKVAAQEDLVERGNWKLVMENNRECYHCENGHPELTCTFFPTYGYTFEQIPDRLLPAHARYLRAESALERACRERDMPYAAIEELSGRPTGFRVQREALDGAGESYTRDGVAASRKLLADFDTPRLGRLSLHLQPNSWFHFLADHAVTFTVLPVAPDQTLVRTTWLVHEDAEQGVDYDLDTLTEVWHQTNRQDGTFVARAQAGVGDPAYEPGPYATNEYQVDAFCTWYIERLKEHLQV
ncbi:MAG TPA: aromatic ring-hydroxylating dioxygenase subunit alpha [Segeticoccus sp.]|uniref:aromatic ring-hydroxylating oxygenase subunit alpha n=1 Tax=Segeticoccus sp. TaxID=2706531 RepID=UPI002D80AAF5|nr:aromatic ring-hydroxylating dioxygenase subunit alpha [Segeticoccus sp.]HET8599979.1 aromatic ring-hydroxylating dioxygenase subunit alpha [Segeticoccus sp.]